MRFYSFLPVAIAILTAAPRIARADSACSSTNLEFTQPRDGQADVPVDTHVRILVKSLQECPASVQMIKLSLSHDGIDVTGSQMLGDDDSMLEFVPARSLLDGTKFLVAVTTPDSPTSRTFSFTTGSRLSAALAGTPRITITDAVRLDDGRDHVVFRIEPGGTDPDWLSVERVGYPQPGTVLRSFAFGPSDAIVGETDVSPGDGDPCLKVTQTDGAGRSLESEPACASPRDPVGGCSVSPRQGDTSFAIAMLGLVAIGSARRRRHARANA
jgi:MYXO-CTERM domain-containing protein